MKDLKVHQVTIKLSTEEYGWLERYCQEHDLAKAVVIRKGFRMYRAALMKKKQEAAQNK